MTDNPTVGDMIEHYITLRDIKEAKTKQFKELMEEAFTKPMAALEAAMLAALQAAETDSMASANGTVYKNIKKTASISDPGEFKRFVIGGELWDLTDWKANAPAIEKFKKENDALPPGINFNTFITVGVRRK